MSEVAAPKVAPKAASSALASARPARATFTSAARELAGRDAVIARLVDLAGPPKLRWRSDSHFASLVRSIVFQQLAGAAAAAIHGRVVAALGGEVTAEALLATPPEALRAAGLSAAKEASLRDLAAKVVEGTVVLDPRGLARESDDEVIERLSTVRGIGRWTAEMFLLFQLRRLDVWPTGDLGVRRGYGLAWGVPMPSPKELEVLGDPFRPYRSVVALYCWRASALYSHSGDGLLVANAPVKKAARAVKQPGVAKRTAGAKSMGASKRTRMAKAQTKGSAKRTGASKARRAAKSKSAPKRTGASKATRAAKSKSAPKRTGAPKRTRAKKA